MYQLVGALLGYYLQFPFDRLTENINRLVLYRFAQQSYSRWRRLVMISLRFVSHRFHFTLFDVLIPHYKKHLPYIVTHMDS